MNLLRIFEIASQRKTDGTFGDLHETCRLMHNLAIALEFGPKAARHFSAADYAEAQEMQKAYDDRGENIEFIKAETIAEEPETRKLRKR